jgi:hypothetical protein
MNERSRQNIVYKNSKVFFPERSKNSKVKFKAKAGNKGNLSPLQRESRTSPIFLKKTHFQPDNILMKEIMP